VFLCIPYSVEVIERQVALCRGIDFGSPKHSWSPTRHCNRAKAPLATSSTEVAARQRAI
jgi:hypothetical protein